MKRRFDDLTNGQMIVRYLALIFVAIVAGVAIGRAVVWCAP